MRITQCNISKSHRRTFASFLSRHSLGKYTDPQQPAIFFGLYQDDFYVLKHHKGFCVVLWRGSDSLKPHRLALAKKRKAKHIAISGFIEKDLKKAKLKFKSLPIVGGDMSFYEPVPLGDEVYVYAPEARYDFYGGKTIDKLRKKCRFKINIVSGSRQYSKKELVELYSRCFCGLRLTSHDGIANTVIELGLMGRRSFYNGGLPGSIVWHPKRVDEILDAMEKESLKIGTVDYDLANTMRTYIDIDDDWLNTEYYEDSL